MPYPFPGMNPYLEHPEFWSEVHHLIIGILAESLNPQLLPKYRAAIEKRVYQVSGEDSIFVEIPDVTVEQSRTGTGLKPSHNVAVANPPSTPIAVTVPMPMEIREGYLEIREIATKEVVTVIEVLSPTNKRPGKGRNIYEQKRQEVLGRQTHLIEIDLLRGGEPMPVFGNSTQGDYRILVSHSDRRPRADLYVFNLPDKIPTFSLPLRAQENLPIVDLQVLLSFIYDRAGYDVAIDYTKEPVPPLTKLEADWVDSLLREKGLR
ncbi:DUF4058 family protein [Scytonema sp. UIC 10036]|uniref:DUF4058 family protein n=1 Tax=Scytonema sp. UIC 10036 TaxID=2304196 RepID=UPI0012DABE95|nr:DUF4058 family protein [Scytonema sp. UIC 10036]MUH00186.1 DUF4058 family protein [Scytonema sp. UIC 10036]